MGLKGILSLLGKAREKVLPYSYPSKVQNRAKWMANSDKRRIYNESMAASRKEWMEQMKAHRKEVHARIKEIREEFKNNRDKVIDGNKPGE